MEVDDFALELFGEFFEAFVELADGFVLFGMLAAGGKDGGQADGCTDSRSSLALIHRGPQRAATAGEDREVRA